MPVKSGVHFSDLISNLVYLVALVTHVFSPRRDISDGYQDQIPICIYHLYPTTYASKIASTKLSRKLPYSKLVMLNKISFLVQ